LEVYIRLANTGLLPLNEGVRATTSAKKRALLK